MARTAKGVQVPLIPVPSFVRHGMLLPVWTLAFLRTADLPLAYDSPSREAEEAHETKFCPTYMPTVKLSRLEEVVAGRFIGSNRIKRAIVPGDSEKPGKLKRDLK